MALEGTALGLVIAVVARPLATFATTLPFGYSVREQVVLGWAGLRGALPVVFATFPVIEGVPNSVEFFNIVFFAVVVSTLLQGATFEPLARRLGVTDTEAALPLPLADAGAMRRLGAEVIEYPVGSEHAIVGCARARARAAARRAAQPPDPRRPGAPATRLDANRGGRPAPPDRPAGGCDRAARADGALARGADRRAAARRCAST